MKKRILAIVGPTGVGKTAAAISAARRINAEIISADSRQIFRYMNIGTAKPTPDQLSKAPHHFIDIIDPDKSYNAGQFGTDGREKMREILGTGKEVIVAGGSGLYIRSLIDGLFGEVAKDDDIRRRLREELTQNGTEHLYQRLRSVDPQTASKIHPNDAKRIERALEVFEITGKRISELHESQEANFDFDPVMIGLTCERAELYKRIEARVDKMIQNGVIDETKSLIEKGYSPKLVSMESLGYREIMQYLKDEISFDRMISLFKQGSRNYAKRQLTWFRKDPRIRWLDVAQIRNPEELADQVITAFNTE
jgi:tRNA dimethylallyltransferase